VFGKLELALPRRYQAELGNEINVTGDRRERPEEYIIVLPWNSPRDVLINFLINTDSSMFHTIFCYEFFS
jgi:hypothetical protein